jgi:hypothetical protein
MVQSMTTTLAFVFQHISQKSGMVSSTPSLSGFSLLEYEAGCIGPMAAMNRLPNRGKSILVLQKLLFFFATDAAAK